MTRIRKTTYTRDWESGYTKRRRLTRSFNTIEEARRFAESKQTTDIFKSKGRFVVEWVKTTDNN